MYTKANAWTKADTNFLISNWREMSNVEIGKNLNKSSKAISIKGTSLKLGCKNGGEYKEGIAGEDYRMYIKMCSVAAKLKEFRNNFNLEGIHKFIINDLNEKGKNTKKVRSINGKVISTSENIVTLQLENYKESFTMASFFTGEISVKV